MADALSGDPALNAVAGASAAAAVLATLFPIDVAKTHMQARGTSALATLRTLLESQRPLRRFYWCVSLVSIHRLSLPSLPSLAPIFSDG